MHKQFERAEPRDFESHDRGHHPRILLAEDDDDFRALLAQWLEVDGYRVAVTATGTALLARLAAMERSEDPPALVITDDRMPGLRGSQMLWSLRAQGSNIPLILITAFGTDELAAEAEKRRVMLLKKPFEIDDLRTLVGWLAPRICVDECIACGRSDDLRPVTDRGSALFCKLCRARIEDHEPPSELGGES
jgi:CheY-like chemotaxis protein